MRVFACLCLLLCNASALLVAPPRAASTAPRASSLQMSNKAIVRVQIELERVHQA